MTDRFERALPRILAHEGGYVDDPRDPGGATNKGITHKTYSGWLRSKGLPDKNVRYISDAEVAAIYRQNYWDRIQGDNLPAGVAYAGSASCAAARVMAPTTPSADTPSADCSHLAPRDTPLLTAASKAA